MNVNRIVDVHNGDTLGALRTFLAGFWDRFGADAMLAPCESPDSCAITTRLVTERNGLSSVNPFAPLMVSNAARPVKQYMEEHVTSRLIALLRPCELRVLVELLNRNGNRPSDTRPILVGVDCLGTFPAEEYEWRAEKYGAEQVTREMLQFARQGGILPYRYRFACQMCGAPMPPEVADVTIDVLGLPAREVILITARDEAAARRLRLDQITDATATDSQRVASAKRLLGLRRRLPDVGIEHFGSFTGKAARTSKTNTGGAGSDDDCFVLESHVILCRPCRQLPHPDDESNDSRPP